MITRYPICLALVLVSLTPHCAMAQSTESQAGELSLISKRYEADRITSTQDVIRNACRVSVSKNVIRSIENLRSEYPRDSIDKHALKALAVVSKPNLREQIVFYINRKDKDYYVKSQNGKFRLVEATLLDQIISNIYRDPKRKLSGIMCYFVKEDLK